ncbi:MAG: GIY-YIG nuclease family protein [Flavobacteriales bacterium]|nr:GIY-YIG nuclease family protein [Flavobacteriales bacterium]
MFITYIIQSEKDRSYYVGHSANLNDRLKRHNEGRSLSTKSKRPFIVVFTKEFATRQEAVAFELQLKSYKSSIYLKEKFIDPMNT